MGIELTTVALQSHPCALSHDDIKFNLTQLTKSQTNLNYSEHSHLKEEATLIKYHRAIIKKKTQSNCNKNCLFLRPTDYHLENSSCNYHQIRSYNYYIKCVFIEIYLQLLTFSRCISDGPREKKYVLQCTRIARIERKSRLFTTQSNTPDRIVC